MVPDRTGLVAVVFILSCGLARDVPAQQLKPGEFVREFGRGELVITRENKRGLHFILYASGKNAHTCGLEGEIREDTSQRLTSREVARLARCGSGSFRLGFE